MELSHLDKHGKAHMVDVSGKDITRRVAIAGGKIKMSPAALDAVSSGQVPKGDVISTARIAGISGAKMTRHLIPLCHPLPIDQVSLEFEVEDDGIFVKAKVVSTARTGVEMEALTSVSLALLTIYDMCKAVDKDMKISSIKLLEKSGGRSGHYVRGEKE